MISANQLPSFTYDQLIHWNRIDLIMNKIVKANQQGRKYERITFMLTRAEIAYFKLHGYQVLSWGREGADFFW